MQHDDPIYLAQYDCYHDLLNNTAWRQFCRYVKKTKEMNCILKAAKAKQHQNAVNTKFGINIPYNHKEAMMF